MAETNQEDMMTIEDVAQYLRVPVSSVYKLAQGGKIPARKVGRHWRFYRPALLAWITANEDTPPKQLSEKGIKV